MKTFKIQLLAATIVAGIAPSMAQAQALLPAAELRGVGASSIQTIVVQTLNCNGNPGSHAPGNIDNLNQLGTNSGSLSNVVEGSFVQTTPTAGSPDFDCNLQEVQPNIEGKYVATGSGTGRSFWRLFSNQLPGTSATNINPFAPPAWNNVQFAFSDSSIPASDLTAFDSNADSNTNNAGPPIQVPFYVLPVALAYNPVYAKFRSPTAGVIDYTFNTKASFVTTDSNGNPTGGIRMSKNTYCKIFNGIITNWNDPALRTSGEGNSLKDPADSNQRWSSVGAPIRLVGRLDNSGTTDLFTRHLALACDGQAGVPVNKFDTFAEALPFDRSSSINLSSFRSDTAYTPTSTRPLAGTVQSLSGAVFIRSPAAINTTQGAEAPGLFLVSDGSSGVRDAINFQPAPAAPDNSIALNGKLGYIGADFVKPAPGSALFSAALQIGTGSKYAVPNATTSNAAFGAGSFLPPQSVRVGGVFATNDSRTGPSRDGLTTVPISRANPLHWTSVLYSDPANTLANPRLGYPITGTTQLLTYTCFATTAKRLALAEYLRLNLGFINRDSTGGNVSVNLVKGIKPSALGLVAQLNIAPMPDSWLNAINETFLKNSTQASGGQVLGDLNLWIEDRNPATKRDFDGNLTNGEVLSNPGCTAGQGA